MQWADAPLTREVVGIVVSWRLSGQRYATVFPISLSPEPATVTDRRFDLPQL
ncbi:hypothetical protein [Arthrobacter sp. Leaf337]|uniref:hypothetical protein n=1 Tax=Arthrobacter sp. Leaf337 TaxID=1736342 RepID=UPI0012E11661|nr:hypothetical protein [Arthrobacter sp. Leaf337]